MRFTKSIATAALLVATTAGAAYASPFNVNPSLSGLSDAYYSTVLSVTPAEAKVLAVDVDVAALQQRLKNNPFLTRSILDQGFSIDQIVGIDNAGNGADVTLYAL